MTETERRDWAQYRSTGAVCVRNKLVERHLGLVHHFAGRMEASRSVEREDLVSAGVVGLMDAIASYDPTRGYRFSTFAATRIRGAMLDELRRRDVAPRSVRKKQRAFESAYARLSAELNRSPRHPELAAVLEVDPQTLWRWKWDVERSRRVSLSEVAAGEGSGLPDASRAYGDEVEERLEREEEIGRLRREMSLLSEREQLILRLYDLESLTLRAIADQLGVTESRVSQLRTRALGRLRMRMSDMGRAA